MAAKPGAPTRGQPAGNSRPRSTSSSGSAAERVTRERAKGQEAAARQGAEHARRGIDPHPPFGTEAEIAAYEAAYADAAEQRTSSAGSKRRRSSRDGSTSSKPSSGSPRRKASAPAARRRRRQQRTTAAAYRQVVGPVRKQATSGMAVIGGVLVLTLVYQLLEHADEAGAVLGGLNKVVVWLREPRPIPYRHR